MSAWYNPQERHLPNSEERMQELWYVLLRHNPGPAPTSGLRRKKWREFTQRRRAQEDQIAHERFSTGDRMVSVRTDVNGLMRLYAATVSSVRVIDADVEESISEEPGALVVGPPLSPGGLAFEHADPVALQHHRWQVTFDITEFDDEAQDPDRRAALEAVLGSYEDTLNSNGVGHSIVPWADDAALGLSYYGQGVILGVNKGDRTVFLDDHGNELTDHLQGVRSHVGR